LWYSRFIGRDRLSERREVSYLIVPRRATLELLRA